MRELDLEAMRGAAQAWIDQQGSREEAMMVASKVIGQWARLWADSTWEEPGRESLAVGVAAHAAYVVAHQRMVAVIDLDCYTWMADIHEYVPKRDRLDLLANYIREVEQENDRPLTPMEFELGWPNQIPDLNEATDADDSGTLSEIANTVCWACREPFRGSARIEEVFGEAKTILREGQLRERAQYTLNGGDQ